MAQAVCLSNSICGATTDACPQSSTIRYPRSLRESLEQQDNGLTLYTARSAIPGARAFGSIAS